VVTDLERRIAEGVAELRARFGEKLRATPSLDDLAPLGSGERNRHGMPRVPPGQRVMPGGHWPVLDLGRTPGVSREKWRLEVDGAVGSPLSLNFAELMSLPQVEVEADFHCVTGWSVLDTKLAGVRLETVLALARPVPEATHVMTRAYDGYRANLPIEEAIKEDVLLVVAAFGAPLQEEHGGPVRIVVPELYAWKGVKWLKRIEVMKRDRRGYWEIRGYSRTGYPWRNDRRWRLPWPS